MEDKLIVDLFFARNEEAISRVQTKYGNYLEIIAYNILKSREDSEECVNDAYKRLWDTIPPNKPEKLGAYASKITRNIALNRYNFNTAEKRNQNLTIALTELEGFLPSGDFAKDSVDKIAFTKALNAFLHSLPEKKRNMFIMRYWYLVEIKDIADKFCVSEANVKTTLLRLREKLKKYLEKEGIRV